MDVRPNPITLSVADYCQAYRRNEVRVDKRYQRSGRVWPARAQSYLIETILRGFPIPKLTLHQKTDLKSRTSLKYVVDGQQRTNAIIDFFAGSLRLSRSLDLEDARGKTLDGLSEELQQAFLSYPLQFDQFEAVDEDVVREYFRRINSFTAPLNPEEQRNANFQGNMKWFILRLAERHTETLISLGTISERQVVRMADQKLLAEVVHAMLNGVRTTDARLLARMYGDYDRRDVPGEDYIEDAISSAFNHIMGWRDVHLSVLVTRGYLFYSLLLAVIAVDSEWPTLQSVIKESGNVISENAEQNLLELADALLDESDSEYFEDFLRASNEKTNTKDQRETRIKWLAAALTQSG